MKLVERLDDVPVVIAFVKTVVGMLITRRSIILVVLHFVNSR